MSQVDHSLEGRVEELSARLLALELKLEQVTARIDGAVTFATAQGPVVHVPPAKEIKYEEATDVSEEVLTWVGRTSFLPRLAAVCFLMVIALILRTVTDSDLVNKLVGSGLGMGYATVLMVVGWYMYGKESPLAPVFTACGALLMSSIVVETHTHFQSLPIVPAYLTLIATGVGTAYISRKYNAFTPISVGILGMCFAGAAMDYPHPYFPYLSLVLFTANVLGYFAARMKQCSWLRWTVLVVSMVMLQFWGFRLGVTLRRGETMPPELAPDFFLPVLAVFLVTYFVLALLGVIRANNDKISRFDSMLPTINLLWAFSAALNVVNASGGNVTVLGVVGVLVAIGHIVVSFWLARRGGVGAPGASSFLFASGALLALILPAATGKFVPTLPVISLVAISMAVMSRVWKSGTVRFTTYIFHVYCCAALAFSLYGDGPKSMDAVNILPAGLLALIILYQYNWCRRWPPPVESSFFNSYDSNDRSAVLLLVAGLISGFYMVRLGIFQTLHMIPGDMQRDIFRSSQSVLINGSAIAMILFAYMRKDKEIRNVAILVTLVGAVKVFLFDLLGIHGLPLVMSVFSFGAAAAIESVALGRWPKKIDHEEPVAAEQ
ncbi:MAG: hypothetical protein GJV46_04835 [Geobacter sp.]|nr:hypothetical protein [Geobacter sp.]